MKFLILITAILFVFFNYNVLGQGKLNDKNTEITTCILVNVKQYKIHDTLTLVLPGPFFYDGAPERGATQILTSAINQQGECTFRIKTGASPFHICLFLSSNRNKNSGYLQEKPNLDNFLIEPGDSIKVVFGNDSQFFFGRGADLFKVQHNIQQIDKGQHLLKEDTLEYFDNDTKKWLRQKDSILDVQLAALSEYSSKISATSYGIIKADVIGLNRDWIYRRISFSGPFFSSDLPLKTSISDLCLELQKRPEYIDPRDRAALSPIYVNYLYDKLRIEVKYERANHNIDTRSDENYFPFIVKKYTGILRDKLLAFWLIRTTSFNDLQAEYVDNALSVMQTPTFIEIAKGLKTAYGKGQQLTDFDFKDFKNNTVHLADFKGKILVVDLWFSGCHGCIDVAKGLPFVEREFNSNPNVAFISISIDKDRDLWLRSINKNPIGQHYTHFTTSSAIYLYTGGTGQDNPFIKRYVRDGSYPQLFLIDKNGTMYSSTPARPINKGNQMELIAEIRKALSNN